MGLMSPARTATPIAVALLAVLCVVVGVASVAADGSSSSSTGAAAAVNDNTMILQIYSDNTCTQETAGQRYTWVSSINGGCGILQKTTSTYVQYACVNTTGTSFDLTIIGDFTNSSCTGTPSSGTNYGYANSGICYHVTDSGGYYFRRFCVPTPRNASATASSSSTGAAIAIASSTGVVIDSSTGTDSSSTGADDSTGDSSGPSAAESSTGSSLGSSTAAASSTAAVAASTGSFDSSTGVASLGTTLVYRYYNDSACTLLNPLTYTFVGSINGGCGLYPRSTAAYDRMVCHEAAGTKINITVTGHYSNTNCSGTASNGRTTFLRDATTCYSSGDNIYFTFSCLSSASAPVSSSSTGASIESSTGSSIEESSTGAYSSTGVASLDTTMVYQYYNDSACTALNPLSYTFVSSINAGCGALSSDQSAQYICQNTTGTEFSFTYAAFSNSNCSGTSSDSGSASLDAATCYDGDGTYYKVSCLPSSSATVASSSTGGTSESSTGASSTGPDSSSTGTQDSTGSEESSTGGSSTGTDASSTGIDSSSGSSSTGVDVSSSTGAASLDTTLVLQYYDDSSCTVLNPAVYTYVSGECTRSNGQYAERVCHNTTGTLFSFTFSGFTTADCSGTSTVTGPNSVDAATCFQAAGLYYKMSCVPTVHTPAVSSSSTGVTSASSTGGSSDGSSSTGTDSSSSGLSSSTGDVATGSSGIVDSSTATYSSTGVVTAEGSTGDSTGTEVDPNGTGDAIGGAAIPSLIIYAGLLAMAAAMSTH